MKPNPIILAIETATSCCSVALNYKSQTYTRDEVGNNIHSKVLLSMVAEVLNEAHLTSGDLDAVTVGQGPGSFTGLRIGVGVAQGLAYGADVPMIGVSSLDALANQCDEQGAVIAGIDARMDEVYWCEYLKTQQGVQRIGELKVSPPEDIVSSGTSKVQLLGNAWAEYSDQLTESLMNNASVNQAQTYPMADALLVLAQKAYQRGELISAVDFAPEYVRNDVAKKSSKKAFK